MSKARALAKSLYLSVPPRWLAAFEYYMRPGLRDIWKGPFNGQHIRQQIFRDLMRAFEFQAVVETGTFRGSTTEFMASESAKPLFTVESNPLYFHYARLRLRGHPNVRMYPGDSRSQLAALARNPAVPRQNVFFYLDAHWEADLPLLDEVELIFSNWRDPVIMVDDFQVPDDTGYKFDDYGDGKRLCLDYLAKSTMPWTAFFPSAPASAESGSRRGCAVLSDARTASRLSTISSLRPYRAEALSRT